MDSIEFKLQAFDYRNFGSQTEVSPLINGSPLRDMVASVKGNLMGQHAGMQTGLRADEVAAFGPEYFLGESKHRLWRKKSTIGVLACSCGLSDCWTLETPLEITDETVAWPSFLQPDRPGLDYSDLGGFSFEFAQYIEAVEDLNHRLL